MEENKPRSEEEILASMPEWARKQAVAVRDNLNKNVLEFWAKHDAEQKPAKE